MPDGEGTTLLLSAEGREALARELWGWHLTAVDHDRLEGLRQRVGAPTQRVTDRLGVHGQEALKLADTLSAQADEFLTDATSEARAKLKEFTDEIRAGA